MATKLGKHDGKEIIGCAIAVRNAGDGLSAAMQVEPEIIKDGTRVFIVMEGVVHGISYKDAANNETKTIRVHNVKAGTATLVDEEFAREVLDKQAVKIEEFRGTQRLDFTAGDDEPGKSEGGDGDEV